MTREEREKLCEIMGYLWAKSEDTFCAVYAEDLSDMLAKDEKKGAFRRALGLKEEVEENE